MGTAHSVSVPTRGMLMTMCRDQVAALVDLLDPEFRQYRQNFLDFGIDGDMLTRLPKDQLGDALRRAGVENEDHLALLLEEVETIRAPRADGRKLDRAHLREFLGEVESHYLDWDQRSESSAWSGVEIDDADRVIGLELTLGHISGRFSGSIGKISQLRHLHATSNNFVGPIPESLGFLSKLSTLCLGHNHFSGRIPEALTRLTSLQSLDLKWNALTGAIPAKLGSLTGLKNLSLGHNKLSGSLPKDLGSMHSLIELRLRENNLSGKIPPLLGNLQGLHALDLTSNALHGHLPASLGSLTSLRELWLGQNLFVGLIPESLGKLSTLESLDLSENKFSGKIPTQVLKELASLLYLDLSRNALGGEIPTSITCLTSLVSVNLSRNQLSGPIPEGMGMLSSLNTLNLASNALDGVIPCGLGACTNLCVLSLSRNGLAGTIPEDLRNLESLRVLRLDGNRLKGEIPSWLGTMGRLRTLQLQSNVLSGNVPPSLGNLENLTELFFRDNKIQGRLPGSLGQLARLKTLRVEKNPALRGPIPLPLASRKGCFVSASDTIIQDTEASMLAARLCSWYLVPRKEFLRLQELPGHKSMYPYLVSFVSTLVPYQCHLFRNTSGRRMTIQRRNIAFFCHCWDLPKGQASRHWSTKSPNGTNPGTQILEGPHPDTPDREKLRHMKAILEATPMVEFLWVDFLCVQLEDLGERKAAGRSVPFLVQNCGRLYALASDEEALARLKSRAWCRLEAFSAACPHQAYPPKSVFSPELTDERDRPYVAEAALKVVNTMELAGQMDPDKAQDIRSSCLAVLFPSSQHNKTPKETTAVKAKRSCA